MECLIGCAALELDEAAQAFAVDGIAACMTACNDSGTAAAVGGKLDGLSGTSRHVTSARCLCVAATRASACPNTATSSLNNFIWPVYANNNSNNTKLPLQARRELPVTSPSLPTSSPAASSSTAFSLSAALGAGVACVFLAAVLMIAMTRGKSWRQTSSSSSNANANANPNANANADIEMQRVKEAAAVDKIAAPKAFVDGGVTALNAPEDAAKRNSAALPFHYPSPSVPSPLAESGDRKIRHQHSMPGFKNFFFRSSPLSHSRLSQPPTNNSNNPPDSGVDIFHLHHPRAGTSLEIIRPSASSFNAISYANSISSRSVSVRHAAEEDSSSDHSSESHEPLSRKSSDIYLSRKSSDTYLGRRSLEAFGRKSHDVPLARNLSHKSSRLGRNVMRRPSEEDEDDGDISISRHPSAAPQRSGSRLARAVGQLFGINNNPNQQEILTTVPPQIRTFRSISADTEETEGSSYESSGTGRSTTAPIRGICSTTSLIGRSDIVNNNINQESSASPEKFEPNSDLAAKRKEPIFTNQNNRIIPPPPFANVSAIVEVAPDNASYTSTVSFANDDDASSTRGIPSTPKALRTAISSASITSSIPNNNIRTGKRGVSMASSSAFNESVFMVSSSSVADEVGGGTGRASPSPSSVFMDILEENIRRDGVDEF
ncbi:hypothetical protein HK100_010110 [Physocladia obscura]|uniref:Uncharacterized protein n=1 Tax=Physocladia obscura TaxID=109957 RepID=A0AAD5T3W9_9FUNG|nr:hypothetical protein HK100_010110 [Physocladia obscura]